MECFLRVAEANTAKNLETCGILAGTLVCTLPKKQMKIVLYMAITLTISFVEKTNFLCDDADNS